MKHLFVPYNLALLMKEKGFNEPCFTYHLWDGNEQNKEFKNGLGNFVFHAKSGKTNTDYAQSKHISAPLYQQATDWLREKHGISVWVYPPKNLWHVQMESGEQFASSGDTYYEALNKAIEEALKLI